MGQEALIRRLSTLLPSALRVSYTLELLPDTILNCFSWSFIYQVVALDHRYVYFARVNFYCRGFPPPPIRYHISNRRSCEIQYESKS